MRSKAPAPGARCTSCGASWASRRSQINWFELPPHADGFEHDEQESGQEEVVVVIAGSGQWRIGGDDVPVTLGSFIRIDPDETRCPHAGPDGLTFVAVGCRPGSYEPRGQF